MSDLDLYRQLSNAHAEALRVGDSPLYGDQREAARHIHTAIGLLGPAPRKPLPFLDDSEE